MSEKITVWNPLSRPVRVSVSGSLLGGMRRGQVDPTDQFAAEAIKKGFIVVIDKKKVVPAQAAPEVVPAQAAPEVVPAQAAPVVELPQVEVEAPAEIAAPEAEDAPVVAEEAAPAGVDEAQEDKSAKSTRSKSQTASKEF
jgi:hypothetical protein